MDMQEIYKFYCVHFLYYKHRSRPVQDIFFKRPELYPFAFISSKQKNRPLSELVPRYQYYLDDWTPEFHELTKKKIEARFEEMDERFDKDDVFYKNDEETIKLRLQAVGMSVE